MAASTGVGIPRKSRSESILRSTGGARGGRMNRRTSIAAFVGVVGGLATMIGPTLPWLRYPEQADPSFGPVPDQTLNGLAGDPFGVMFAIALTVAAAWLWAGSDAKKAVAF